MVVWRDAAGDNLSPFCFLLLAGFYGLSILYVCFSFLVFPFSHMHNNLFLFVCVKTFAAFCCFVRFIMLCILSFFFSFNV